MITILQIREKIDNGSLQEAYDLACEAAANNPLTSDIQYTLGKLLIDLGRSRESLVHFEMAGLLMPKDSDDFIDHRDLIMIMSAFLQSDWPSGAKSLLIKQLDHLNYGSLEFNDVEQLVNITIVMEECDLGLRILDKCFTYFEPTDFYVDFILLMAKLFRTQDDQESELQLYETILEQFPLNERIHNAVSRFYAQIQEFELAAAHVNFISKYFPNYQSKTIAVDFFNLCKTGAFAQQEKLKKQWLDNPELEQDVRAPFATLLATDDPAFIHGEARKFSEWTQLVPKELRTTQDKSRFCSATTRKIRIGYVSPDFRDHAVCHLISDLIKHHDREKFEVFGYGITFKDDSIYRKNIEQNFDYFRALENEKTPQIIKSIESDQLDICIDLCGYTMGFNHTLFNRLNGPIKVNYLGYPGTLGHPQYDFIIGDKFVTPNSLSANFSEKIVQLDCCYQPNSPSRSYVPISKAEARLPEDSFVFCNFNTRQKLNLDTVLSWKNILSECKDSVLWILDPGASTQAEILQILGINKNRVIFAPSVQVDMHLGRVGHADLFLDSFPYGAHTTASDAVFRGVPILARTGRSFQSRVAESIISYAGLPELVSKSWPEFQERAKEFYDSYSDKKRTNYKERLLSFETDRHPYNIAWTTREIEKAFVKMLS